MIDFSVIASTTIGLLQIWRAAAQSATPEDVAAFREEMLRELRESEKALFAVDERQLQRQDALNDAVPRK